MFANLRLSMSTYSSARSIQVSFNPNFCSMGCVLQSSTIGNYLFWREAKLYHGVKPNYIIRSNGITGG